LNKKPTLQTEKLDLFNKQGVNLFDFSLLILNRTFINGLLR
jgi:hypothetical protein